MAFIKNIIDLTGILTLLVLTIPSKAANVDCNGKPFHCVNSTHFMICVDLGSGVSSTIDDFVIPCPPTTVCQGSNRFECEFPAVTTTIAPSVAPLSSSVSETIETVTTPNYEVITSIPFEEYYNTLSTKTLSENVLVTHQTIATEPTVSESTIQLPTDVTQKIDTTITRSESNSTLSETISNADIQSYSTILTLLRNNTSATVTEHVSDTTENINVTIPESEPSSILVEVIQKDLTTHAPFVNNNYTSAKNLIPNATEQINVIKPELETNSYFIETILNVTDGEPTLLFTSTSSALPIIAETTLGSILNENAETTLRESILSDTTLSANILQNDLTAFTPLPNNLRTNSTHLKQDNTEHSNVTIPDYKVNSTSTDSVTRATDFALNEATPFFNSNSSALLVGFSDTTTESTLTEETISNVSTSRETIQSVQSYSTTLKTLPYNESVTVTDLILNTTENAYGFLPESDTNLILSKTTPNFNSVRNNLTKLLPNKIVANAIDWISDVTENENVIERESIANALLPESDTNLTLSKTTPSLNFVLNNLTTFFPNKIVANATDLISDVTENENVIEPESKISSTLNETVKNYTTLDTLHSTSMSNNAADIFTISVLTEVTETSHKSTDSVLNYQTTLKESSNTASPGKMDNVTEPTVTDTTQNINTEKIAHQHQTLSEFIPSVSVADITDAIAVESSITAPENINLMEIDYNSKHASSGIENIVQNDNSPLYTQSTTDIPNKTVPVTNDSVYDNILTNEINKTKKLYSNATDGNSAREVFMTPSAETTSISYQGFSTILTLTDSSNIIVETSPNPKLEATVSAKELGSITFDKVYYNSDSENIGNNQGISTNLTDRKPILSENVLSTGTINNTPTPTLVVVKNENLLASSSVSVTDTPVLHSPTELIFTTNTDALSTELKKTNQESNIQGDTTLERETNNNVLPISTKENNNTSKPFQIVNISTSELLVPEHVARTESPKPTYNLEAHLIERVESVDDIIALDDYNQQQSINLPVDLSTLPAIEINVELPEITDNINEFATEQTTKATTFNVTKISEVNFLEALNFVPSQVSITEPTPDFLQSPIDMNKTSNLKLQNLLIEAATIATTSTTTTETLKRLDLNKSLIKIGHDYIKKAVNKNDASITTAAEGNVENKQHLPIVYDKVIEKDVSKIAIESRSENNKNAEHNISKSRPDMDEEHTLLTIKSEINTDNSALYPNTDEVEKNLYVESIKNIESVKSKLEHIPDLTQTTMSSLLVDNVKSEMLSVSDIIPDITTSAFIVDEPRLYINSPSIAQDETPTMISPELYTSSFKIEVPVRNSVTTETVTKIPVIPTESLVTYILGAGKSVTSVTESSRVNKAGSTVRTADANVLTGSTNSTANIGFETTQENNPLINFLLNTPAVSMPYTEPTVPSKSNSVSLEFIPIPKETEKNTSINRIALGDIGTPVNGNASFLSSAQQESYTESIIKYTDTNLQTSLNSSKETVHLLGNRGQQTENYPSAVIADNQGSTQVLPENHADTLYLTSQTKQAAEKSNRSPVDIIEIRPPYQDITTDKQITSILTTDISKPPQQASNANYYIENISESKQITVLEQPALDSIKTRTTQDLLIKLSMPNRTVGLTQVKVEKKPNTENIDNESTITEGNDMVSKQAKITDTNIHSTLNQPIDTTAKTQISHEINTESQTDIPKIPSVIFIQDTATPKQHKRSSDTSATVPINEPLRTIVVRKPYIQITSQFNTEQPMKERTSKETRSQKPMVSDITTRTVSRPDEDYVVLNPEAQVINVPRYATSPSIEDENPVLGVQSTSGLTAESWSKVSRASEITVHKDNQPNFVKVVSNPQELKTRDVVSQVRKQQDEQSDTLELSESVVEEDKEVDSEASERNEGVSYSVTPATETSVATSKDTKTRNGLVNELSINENIDSRLPLTITTNKMRLKSTIEMTTQKVEEDSDGDYKSIINIQLLSTKTTENFTQATAALSSDPKEKITKTESTINAQTASNITSKIKNSTVRYSPKTKSQFANIRNASVPTFESATNSNVCKQNSRGRFSDSIDCRKFYICLGKPEPIKGFCPNNTVFSELRKQCTKNLSHCVRNNQFQCISKGRFSDYLYDNIYYICVENNVGTFIRFKLQCQSGYHLNKTLVRCALNTEASQLTSQQSRSDISKNNSEHKESPARSEKLVVESSKQFECNKEGRFPDANDCRKYYICKKKVKSQYRQKIRNCDSDELFHKDKKKCVDADSYECS